jgi:hypothetical protein
VVSTGALPARTPGSDVADGVLDEHRCLQDRTENTAGRAEDGDRPEVGRDEYCFTGGGIGGPSAVMGAQDAPPRARSAGGSSSRRQGVTIGAISASFRSGEPAYFAPAPRAVASGPSTGPSNSGLRPHYASCFLPGTRILTPAGERRIEDLRIGDLVTTASGDRPIKFIPKQTFRRSAGKPWAEGVAPVRIEAGAFGGGLPNRTLVVSPFHAFYRDGLLVEAQHLVNGSTITRMDYPGEVLEYLNIELDDHDLIRANGVLAETYRPSHILAREKLDNFAEYVGLYPGQEYQSFPACAPYREERALAAWWKALPWRIHSDSLERV